MEITPISTLLKELQDACDLRQRDLAEVMGVTIDRVKNIAAGKAKKLTQEEMQRLMTTLNVSAQYLATGQPPMFASKGGAKLAERLTEVRLSTSQVRAVGLQGDMAVYVAQIAQGLMSANAQLVNDGLALVAQAALSGDERELLNLYRKAPLPVKMAAVGALQGGSQQGGGIHASVKKGVGIAIGSIGRSTKGG